MKAYSVTVPEVAMVAATRGIAGAGIGLLVAGFLRPDTRQNLGWTLLAIGALTTIPLAMVLFGKRETGVAHATGYGRSRSHSVFTTW